MLKRIQNFMKDKEAVLDTANLILGLLMLTALVVFLKIGNRLSMFVVIFCGGAMNICGGFRYLRRKDRRQMGYSMLLFGMVILVLGLVLLLL